MDTASEEVRVDQGQGQSGAGPAPNETRDEAHAPSAGLRLAAGRAEVEGGGALTVAQPTATGRVEAQQTTHCPTPARSIDGRG